MSTDNYDDGLEAAIRRRVPAGTALDPRVALYGGNGRTLYLEHRQSGHRVYNDRNGRALTMRTARRIGEALADRLQRAGGEREGEAA